MDLLEELSRRVVVADCAMGTQLLAAGAVMGECLEEWVLTRPESVSRVHAEALAAGARVIRTNSFGASAARLAKFGFERRVGELNWSAAQLARSAARGTGALVAGCVGPLGLSEAMARERGWNRRTLFEDQIGALLDGGSQLIILETFQNLEELLIALEMKHSLHHCPVVCNVACGEDGRLADGTPLAEAFASLRAAGADVVGVNCTENPRTLPALIAGHAAAGPLAAFPSAGLPKAGAGALRYDFSPQAFVEVARQLIAHGAGLIGGCCGTTAAHLAALTAELTPKESAS